MNYARLYDFLLKIYGKASFCLPGGLALPPIRATIEGTYNCNLRCAMCYQRQERKKRKVQEELTAEEIKKIIDQMPPKTLISLTGGEIFTKKYAFEIIEYATKSHSCNIVTSGTLIDKEVAARLVSSGLMLVGISIDGLSSVNDKIRGKGTFEKSLNAIRLIQKEKQKTGGKLPLIDVKTVILPENTGQIYQLYKLCQKLGVDFFTISVLKESDIQLSPPVLENIPKEKYFVADKTNGEFKTTILEEQIARIKKENARQLPTVRFYPGNLYLRLQDYFDGKVVNRDYYSCNFPWTAFNVSPYGDVFPCISLNIGSLKEKSLRKIWNGRKMREFRRRLKKAKVYPACNGCCNLWLKNSF